MNGNYLKGEIKKNGYTLAQTAALIGMSESTIIRKIKRGSFGLDEANKLINLLGISNPNEIFFS